MQASASPAQVDTSDVLTADLAALIKLVIAGTSSEFLATIERLGLSFSQVKTLGVLREAEGPLSVKALSDRLGLSLPAVSRGVETLVRRDEVKRDEDPTDRRCKRVALTARGRRTYDQLWALKLAGVRRFVEELAPDDREALADAVRNVMERTGR